MSYKRNIIENRLNIKKNIAIPMSTANKMLPGVVGSAIVSTPKSILKTILINKQTIFLHRTNLVKPLSEAPKIAIISKERRAKIKANASIIIKFEKTPKKYKIAKINAIITPSAILYKQLQNPLFILKSSFKLFRFLGSYNQIYCLYILLIILIICEKIFLKENFSY